jgi:hypothetical protein
VAGKRGGSNLARTFTQPCSDGAGNIIYTYRLIVRPPLSLASPFSPCLRRHLSSVMTSLNKKDLAYSAVMTNEDVAPVDKYNMAYVIMFYEGVCYSLFIVGGMST